MVDDMTIRNLSPAPRLSYMHAITEVPHYFGRSPDRLGLEDVRAFQEHLVLSGLLCPALNQTVCTLRIFFAVIPGDADQTACRSRASRNVAAQATDSLRAADGFGDAGTGQRGSDITHDQEDDGGNGAQIAIADVCGPVRSDVGAWENQLAPEALRPQTGNRSQHRSVCKAACNWQPNGLPLVGISIIHAHSKLGTDGFEGSQTLVATVFPLLPGV